MTHHRFTTSGANHWQRNTPMGELRRQHVFGKIKAMADEEAQLAREAGEKPQPGLGNGTAYAILGLLTLAVWFVLFKGLGLI